MRSVLPRGLSLALLCVLWGGSSLVPAQLTDQDIASLQTQGAREGWTFTVARSEVSDYPLSQICGMVEPPNWRDTAQFEVVTQRDGTLPTHFDWRQFNAVTPIRNQGGCGSCWAFATVGPFECNLRMYDGYNADLSEQWLVSCNREGWGCSGGWWAHDYHQWKADHCGGYGAVLETAFHYMAQDLPCNCPYSHDFTFGSWAFVGGWDIPTVDALKQAILDYGPISVAVCVDGAFQGYSHGIFNACSATSINHAVVLVGWQDDEYGGYWIMRNSWGSGWGEQGYMKIRYNCDSIGYAATFIRYRPYLISGLVTRPDGSGVPGAVLSGLPRNPVSADNGYFSTRIFAGFSGTVTPTRAGFVIDPPSVNLSNVPGDLGDVNFTATPLPFVISGHVRKANGTPLPGVALNGLPGNPVSDADGYYSVVVDGSWSGQALPWRLYTAFYPIYRTYYDVTTDKVDQDFTATVEQVSISGDIRRSNGQPVPGVPLYGLPGECSTFYNGHWGSWVDKGWSGTVTPAMDCLGFAPLNRTFENVTTTITGQDFGASDELPTISGFARNADGAGVSGVVLNGLPGNPATDLSGYYTTTVTCGFIGLVTPVESEYSFDPPQRAYGQEVVTDQEAQDFLATPLHDCNHNGVADVRDIAAGTSLDDNSNGVPDECELAPGDLNCDGQVGFDDINPFVLAISGHAEYQTAYPSCLWLNGDFDGNGQVDFDDINGFVAALSR